MICTPAELHGAMLHMVANHACSNPSHPFHDVEALGVGS